MTSYPTAAGGEPLDGVAFVNPDAAQARSRRRNKLGAPRGRTPAMAPPGKNGGEASSVMTSPEGEKEERKQQRMLRNRESASLSRKRRGDRVGELEGRLEVLEAENRRLREYAAELESGEVGSGSGAGLTPLPTATRRTPVQYPSGTSAFGFAPTSTPPTTPSERHFFGPGVPPPGAAGSSFPAAVADADACFNDIVRPAEFA